jgi:hypothetical protein
MTAAICACLEMLSPKKMTPAGLTVADQREQAGGRREPGVAVDHPLAASCRAVRLLSAAHRTWPRRRDGPGDGCGRDSCSRYGQGADRASSRGEPEPGNR